MVITKRKKVVRYRGHTTHGGGHRKKRRGAGSRGGHGRAGTGKRAGHKKAGGMVITGKRGFRPRREVVFVVPTNVGYFTRETVEKLVAKGKAVKDGDSYSIDLETLGYTKLLGTGNTTLKLHIRVLQYSSRAEEKIKAAGGDIVSSKKSGVSSSSSGSTSESEPESESE
ncbi:50S ribosomal protein L15 [Candidatus Woesearchaeota archaeon CG10_big_fil_rev_8_21_14_0_10_36_11]|nr:MAG: 50S ribosomal protein L15 [Candidatus Woesearchaeota archaeon CG10_big_fil_rev_8_21_14_0_10_36_11]